MLFRTTSQTNTNQAIRFVSNFNSNIAKYQRQISSGVRLERASDDPVSFRQVTTLSTQLQHLQSDALAVNDTEAKLNMSVLNMQQSHDILVKAKSLAQQGVQANTPSARNAIAIEVESLLANMKDIASSQLGGSYLYSGVRADQPPYDFGDPEVEGGPLVADYQGASESSYAYIGTRVAIETFYAGDEVFESGDRGEMLVYGDTGAKNGAGTDSMVGRANLLVSHTLTTYDGTSGVSPGASSVDGDTVLGPAGDNQITVVDTSGTGTSGTVQLNGGEPIPWSSTDVDLQIVDSNGRHVYLDMSSVIPGFSGTDGLTADGTISVDGGVTSLAIDFSASQTIVDSTSGGQAHIDTRQITRSGTDYLEFPGTANAFQVLHELAQDLRNNRDMSNADYGSALDRRIGELGEMADHILVTMGRQSASLQSLEELEYRIEDIELEVETQLSNVKSTDIPETVLRLQNEQSLLEFTYSVTAQITSTSLLNFLR
ncbi:flagellar hook-associated protein FlgL [Mariniblastus sp.]|jgi:flagellar hook-associated protein 3 FlgL|nr:flagellar hook-associated protein FlgL [Mariniblastus sp.]MDB2526282.1 flagellar hook-associated protein FlgL [Mariniblastus sp.]MDB4370874.1 flagellar hook-associated protein FlgL [Mariniblastus sp.]MDC3256291.1 flagellar hook-associated protein FlgL [bacterium]